MSVVVLDEGDAILPLVKFGLQAEEHLLAVEPESAASVGHPRAGVEDRALPGRRVVSGSDAAALAPEQPLADAVLYPGVDPAQCIGGPSRAGDETADALVGVVMNLVMAADGIDRPPHGAPTVEQRGRALDDLHPLQLRRVDQFPMISRLRGQGPGSDPVLQNQDPVAVETADDGPGCTRSETPLGDSSAHLVVQQLAHGDVGRLGQVIRSQRFDALKSLENGLVFLMSRHRHLVSARQQLQYDVRLRRRPRVDGHGRVDLGEQAVQMAHQVIGPGGHPLELVGAVVFGHRAAPEIFDRHADVMQGFARLLERYGALQRTMGFRRGHWLERR